MTALRRSAPLAVLALFLLVSGVSAAKDSIDSMIGKKGVYTLVNLHPDEQRAKLYAVNYQQLGLIPLCTEVRILELKKKRMKFEVKKTGKEYAYDYHKAAVDDFRTHLEQIFGKACNSAKVAKMSKVDQKGIKKGRALPGMTRQGVIFAMGYPPKHQTPDLDADTWLYWQNRWNRVAVEFDDKGKVEGIRE